MRLDINSAAEITALSSELGRRTAGRVDLLPRRPGELVCFHAQRNADVTGTEDLDQMPASYGAPCRQDVGVDVATVREQRHELVEVDDLVLRTERVAETLELRYAHVERHLAALELRRHLIARLGALGAAPGGLALGALTAADTCLRLVSARSGTQVVDFESHYSTSSTDTRW